MTEPPAVPDAAPSPVVGLVRAGTLDADLAALLSLTVEGGIPLIVAGAVARGREAVRDGLLALVPPGAVTVRLAGSGESFAWMPEAGELGWRSAGPPMPSARGAVMVAELHDGPGGTWGGAAHLAIRALTTGYSMAATAEGTRLEDVLGRLAAHPVAALDDELTRLGVVLLLDDAAPDARMRVAAAHYLRPVARDPGGHVQRLPPAVLATWSARAGRYDHFAWGVTAELAGRTGRRPLEFEREQARRASRFATAAATA